MTMYTARQMAEIRYRTTKRPMVLVGPRPAQLLNVASETRNVMTKKAKEMLRRSQTESVVPSSYSWNPTKPLMSRHTHNADARPACTATK